MLEPRRRSVREMLDFSSHKHCATIEGTLKKDEAEKHHREVRLYALHLHHRRQIASLAADPKGQVGIGGRYSLIIEGRSYEVFARRVNTPNEGDGHTYEVQIAGQRFEVYVEDEREKTLAGAAKSPHPAGEAMVRAPMPGLVLGIPLDAGATVARGQAVVVLEAMKMENDLPSPIAGTIKEVRVSKGQTVNQGD